MKSDFCFLGNTLHCFLRRNKDAIKLLVGGLTNMILFNSLLGGKCTIKLLPLLQPSQASLVCRPVAEED